MTTFESSPSTKPADDFPLPKLRLHIEDPSAKAVDIFRNGIKLNEALRNAVLATFKWLFTPETVPTHLKSIAVIIGTKNSSPLAEWTDDELRIHFSHLYIEQVNDVKSVEHVIPGMIIHYVAWYLVRRRFVDDSYPEEISRGLANYVRYKEGFAPHCEQTKSTEGTWYDFRTMPYFLDWLEKKYGDGTISRLNLSFGAQFDENIFEKVIKNPIASLWEMYCSSLEEVREEEKKQESNRESLVPWPIPKLKLRVEDLEHEGLSIFQDAFKPKDALTKAVLTIFKHLYTPKTVPVDVQEFCLVLRPGMKYWAQTEGVKSHWEIRLSLDHIKSAKSWTTQVIMVYLISTISCCYNRAINNDPDDLGFKLGLAIAGEWDARRCQTRDFLVWMESTVGEGTVGKLNQCLTQYGHYASSWFVDATGKTVDKLWSEYKATFTQPPSLAKLVRRFLRLSKAAQKSTVRYGPRIRETPTIPCNCAGLGVSE